VANESDLSAARAAADSQAQAAAAAAKSSSDETVARHLLFIDRLLADKAELSRQCEGLAAQLRGLEERHAAAGAKREEVFGREMKRQIGVADSLDFMFDMLPSSGCHRYRPTRLRWRFRPFKGPRALAFCH